MSVIFIFQLEDKHQQRPRKIETAECEFYPQRVGRERSDNSVSQKTHLSALGEFQKEEERKRHKRKREFFRTVAVHKRICCVRSKHNYGHRYERVFLLDIQKQNSVFGVSKDESKRKLQKINADKRAVRYEIGERVRHKKIRTFLIENIPIKHLTAEHRLADSEVDVRVDPFVHRINKRTGTAHRKKNKHQSAYPQKMTVAV